MKRRNSPISSRISAGGRDQFSALNEKMVRKSIPRSPAARTVRRSASTPRRCPSPRGRPRAAAQRPLPSMMMATCRGTAKSPISAVGSGPVFAIALQPHTVRISLSLVANILSTSAIASSVAFSDLVILFEPLEHVKAVAPHVPHGDPRRLGIFVRDFDQVPTPLLVEFRDAQPQHLAFG